MKTNSPLLAAVVIYNDEVVVNPSHNNRVAEVLVTDYFATRLVAILSTYSLNLYVMAMQTECRLDLSVKEKY